MTLRWLWLTAALLAPACGFTAPASSGDDTVGPTGPGPTGPTGPSERHCTTTDPSLRLCIDFDDTTALTGDGSGRHHDATTSSIMVMPRDSEQAVLLSTASRVTVAETPDSDITNNLTISLWARPASHPTASYWALDNNTQYAVSYQATGQYRCGLGPDTVDSALWFDPGHWHHVACTFDLSAQMLMIYVDGSVEGCRQVRSAIATGGTAGTAIGSNINAGPTFSDEFVGGLDNIQVFARTYSPAELCTASAHSGYCNSDCPFVTGQIQGNEGGGPFGGGH